MNPEGLNNLIRKFQTLPPFDFVRKSVRAQTLSIVISSTLIGAIISSIVVVTYMGDRSVEVAKESLDRYVKERTLRERALLRLADANLKNASKAYWERMQLPNYPNANKFDINQAPFGDGTIRTRKHLFHPEKDVGVFVGRKNGKQQTLTPLQKRSLQTMVDVSEQFGPAYEVRFQSLWWITPDNTVVVYWPHSNWIYEITAPTDMTQEEYYYAAAPEHNPTKELAWTGTFFDPVSKVWMVSALQPIVDPKTQEYLGHVGCDITLDQFMERTIHDRLPHSMNIVFRTDGRLVAHPGKTKAMMESPPTGFLILDSDDADLKAVYEKVLQVGPKGGVIEEANTNSFLSIGFIPETKWYFVITTPKDVVLADARRIPRLILGVSLLILIFDVTAVMLLLRQRILLPLDKIVNFTKNVSSGIYNSHLHFDRKDEMGSLSASLNEMSQALQSREKESSESKENLEKLVQQRTQELTQANKELEAFSYSVSHDLRAPLRSTTGFSQILLEDHSAELSDEAKNMLERIQIASNRMANIVDALLRLSVVSQAQPRMENIDLSAMIQTIADQLTENNDTRNVQWDIQPNLTVRGDGELLRLMFTNLLENSWKYTLHSDPAIIRIRKDVHAGETCIDIADNGIGISQKDTSILFQPFRRLQSAQEFSGLGIGLAIATRVAERHGWKIGIADTAGGGATFYISGIDRA